MNRLTLIILSLVILMGCGGNGNGGDKDTVVGPDQIPTDAGSDADAVAGQDEEKNSISTGAAALFLSLALEDRQESWPTVGGTVSWDETDIGILRYVPADATLDLLTSTTSTSFSTNHVYPLTVGDRLFIVSTRGRKRIQEYAPHSGVAVGSSCEIVTDDNYSGFAILGERVFFIAGDGGLAVVDFPCDAEPEGLIAAAEHGINPNYLFAIGDALVSVDTRSRLQFDVRVHDPSDGAVRESVLTVGEENGLIVDFFAGDDRPLLGRLPGRCAPTVGHPLRSRRESGDHPGTDVERRSERRALHRCIWKPSADRLHGRIPGNGRRRLFPEL